MSRPFPSQIRAARAMLDWSKSELAKAARISVSLVLRFERGGDHNVADGTVALMQDALETEGVRFLADDGNGPGVRYKRR